MTAASKYLEPLTDSSIKEFESIIKIYVVGLNRLSAYPQAYLSLTIAKAR
jgi:hypothetical protein